MSTFRATYTEREATTKLVLVSKFGNSDKFGVSCRFQLQMKWMERRARDLVRLNIWCKNKVDRPILGTYKLNFQGIFKIIKLFGRIVMPLLRKSFYKIGMFGKKPV